MRSHMNAGQDGFRDKDTKQRCDLREGAIEFIGVSRVVDRSITPSAYYLASSGHRLSTVAVQLLPVSGQSYAALAWAADADFAV